MFGIGTKSAKLIAAATVAVGIGAIGAPSVAEAGDDGWRHGGRSFHGHHKHKQFHQRRHDFHGHHGHGRAVVHVWRPAPPVTVIRRPWVRGACHPVVGRGFDGFGRPATFGGTMCYDGFGNGFVVAGSEHVIGYF